MCTYHGAKQVDVVHNQLLAFDEVALVERTPHEHPQLHEILLDFGKGDPRDGLGLGGDVGAGEGLLGPVDVSVASITPPAILL